MLQIKVQGETPKIGKSLCLTCKYAKAVRGQNCQEIVLCDEVFGRSHKGIVPFRISNCSSYHPSTMPWLYEMEEMAWIVEARRRGPSGFQSADDEMEFIVRKPTEHNPSNAPSS